MERGTRFELAHPRVEALVHSLFYVTPANATALYKIFQKSQKKSLPIIIFTFFKIFLEKCMQIFDISKKF